MSRDIESVQVNNPMSGLSPIGPVSKTALWTGRVLGAPPILLLLMSGGVKVSQLPVATEGFAKLGYDPKLLLGLGIVELLCTVLYIIPQTAAIGAILLTGYLGGAIATHLRVGEPWIFPLIMGVLLWVGLVLRQPKLRTVLPWRR